MEKSEDTLPTVKVEVADKTGHSTFHGVTKSKFADLWMREGAGSWVFLESKLLIIVV